MKIGVTIRDRWDFDLSLNAIALSRPFFGRMEAWPDIVIPELKVAIEYDTIGKFGLEHVGMREQSDLRKAEIKSGLQDRINGRQECLHHIIEQMAETGGPQYGERRSAAGPHLGSKSLAQGRDLPFSTSALLGQYGSCGWRIDGLGAARYRRQV